MATCEAFKNRTGVTSSLSILTARIPARAALRCGFAHVSNDSHSAANTAAWSSAAIGRLESNIPTTTPTSAILMGPIVPRGGYNATVNAGSCEAT